MIIKEARKMTDVDVQVRTFQILYIGLKVSKLNTKVLRQEWGFVGGLKTYPLPEIKKSIDKYRSVYEKYVNDIAKKYFDCPEHRNPIYIGTNNSSFLSDMKKLNDEVNKVASGGTITIDKSTYSDDNIKSVDDLKIIAKCFAIVFAKEDFVGGDITDKKCNFSPLFIKIAQEMLRDSIYPFRDIWKEICQTKQYKLVKSYFGESKNGWIFYDDIETIKQCVEDCESLLQIFEMKHAEHNEVVFDDSKMNDYSRELLGQSFAIYMWLIVGKFYNSTSIMGVSDKLLETIHNYWTKIINTKSIGDKYYDAVLKLSKDSKWLNKLENMFGQVNGKYTVIKFDPFLSTDINHYIEDYITFNTKQNKPFTISDWNYISLFAGYKTFYMNNKSTEFKKLVWVENQFNDYGVEDIYSGDNLTWFNRGMEYAEIISSNGISEIKYNLLPIQINNNGAIIIPSTFDSSELAKSYFQVRDLVEKLEKNRKPDYSLTGLTKDKLRFICFSLIHVFDYIGFEPQKMIGKFWEGAKCSYKSVLKSDTYKQCVEMYEDRDLRSLVNMITPIRTYSNVGGSEMEVLYGDKVTYLPWEEHGVFLPKTYDLKIKPFTKLIDDTPKYIFDNVINNDVKLKSYINYVIKMAERRDDTKSYMSQLLTTYPKCVIKSSSIDEEINSFDFTELKNKVNELYDDGAPYFLKTIRDECKKISYMSFKDALDYVSRDSRVNKVLTEEYLNFLNWVKEHRNKTSGDDITKTDVSNLRDIKNFTFEKIKSDTKFPEFAILNENDLKNRVEKLCKKVYPEKYAKHMLRVLQNYRIYGLHNDSSHGQSYPGSEKRNESVLGYMYPKKSYNAFPDVEGRLMYDPDSGRYLRVDARCKFDDVKCTRNGEFVPQYRDIICEFGMSDLLIGLANYDATIVHELAHTWQDCFAMNTLSGSGHGNSFKWVNDNITEPAGYHIQRYATQNANDGRYHSLGGDINKFCKRPAPQFVPNLVSVVTWASLEEKPIDLMYRTCQVIAHVYKNDDALKMICDWIQSNPKEFMEKLKK